MKNTNKNIHLSIPSLSAPSFARPLSPGCPTDTGISSIHTTAPPWWQGGLPTPRAIPMTATALTRENSWNSVLPSPATPTSIPSSRWRIQPGTYVAFSLDTESIAQKFAHHSAAYESVRRVPTRKYVGLVVSSYTYLSEENEDDGEFVEELVVNFVGGSPPPEIGFKDHWISISPSMSSTNQSSPSTQPNYRDQATLPPASMEPLHTATLFPWKNRVQWTTSGTRLIVHKFHESLLTFNLDDEEFGRFEEKVSEDYSSMHSITDITRSPSDEEQNQRIEKMKVPLFAFPAQVWRDIREADERDHPVRFLDEVDEMEK